MHIFENNNIDLFFITALTIDEIASPNDTVPIRVYAAHNIPQL